MTPGCEECRDLQSHEFASASDMVHAFQVVAAESERGALRRIDGEALTASEQEALYSAFDAQGLPRRVCYRFQCASCGSRFELRAEVAAGTGSWQRLA